MRMVINVCVFVSEDVVNGSVDPGRRLGALLWPCQLICIELSRAGLCRWNKTFLIQAWQRWCHSCNPSQLKCSRQRFTVCSRVSGFPSPERLFFIAAVYKLNVPNFQFKPYLCFNLMTSLWHHREPQKTLFIRFLRIMINWPLRVKLLERPFNPPDNPNLWCQTSSLTGTSPDPVTEDGYSHDWFLSVHFPARCVPACSLVCLPSASLLLVDYHVIPDIHQPPGVRGRLITILQHRSHLAEDEVDCSSVSGLRGAADSGQHGG